MASTSTHHNQARVKRIRLAVALAACGALGVTSTGPVANAAAKAKKKTKVAAKPAAPTTAAPTVAPPTTPAPEATVAAPAAKPAAAPAPKAPAKYTGTFDGSVSFGAAVSLTGSTAAEGKYTKDGYEIAKEYLNNAGGIVLDGKHLKIEIKYYDDASKPDVAGQLVEKLITEDKVNFILGPYGSNPTDTVAGIVEKYKVPMVEANGSAESIFNRGLKYTFAVLSPAGNYLKGCLDLVKEKDPNAKRVAIVAETDKFALEVQAGAAAYAKKLGFEVVYNDKYPAKATDISSNLTAIKALKPDVFLGTGHLQDAIVTIKQAKELGLNAKAWCFSVGPTAPEFRAALRKDADYVLGGAQWTSDLKLVGDAKDPFGTPQNFDGIVSRKFSGYESTTPYQVAESAAAVMVFQRAIEAAGTLEPTKVRDAIAKTSFDSFYGRVEFDERGINTTKPMAVAQLNTNGNIYTVFPSLQANRGFQYPAPDWNDR
jgi:branched-chain amino acid transport system substrate-binding protein